MTQQPLPELSPEEAVKLPVPVIGDDLIRWLRTMHPERVIARGETMESAQRRGGVQELIDKLMFFNRVQAKFEADDFASDTEREDLKGFMVWEAPTKEQEESGFVLRAT